MAKELFTIGVAGSLSGQRTAFTPQLRHSALLAQEAWQAQQGAPALAVRLLWGDEQARADLAAGVAEHLVAQGAAAVVGHFASDCALRAAPIYERANIPLLLPSATHRALTASGWRHIFRLCGRDDQMGQALGAWIAKRMGERLVCLLSDGSDYGVHLVQAVAEALVARKVPFMPAAVWPAEADAPTQREALARLVAAAPAGLMFGGSHLAAADLTKQVRTALPNSALIFGDDILVPDYLRRAGDAADGAWIISPPEVGASAEALSFAAAFASRSAEQPGYYAYATYAAMQILLQARQRHAAAHLADAIRSYTWPTVLGTIRFDQQGDRIEPPWGLWQVQRNRFIYIQTLR